MRRTKFSLFRNYKCKVKILDIVKIIGVGLIALVIIIILKQYKPEFAVYVSIIAGIVILFMVMGKLTSIIRIKT